MDLLLLVAKYGVITAAFLVVASSASKELSLLFARIRKQSKFVQLCVFAFIMTAVVYGGSKPSTNSVTTSTEPLNSFNSNVSSTHSATTSTHTLPQWYIEHGYPSTDTDGDGIPDAWERWTHTKPLSNDALVDYDGDGVDNITEFMYICDPIRSDTDGDGLNDNIEIDGMLAGLDDFNPLVSSTFLVEEEYTPGLTICDIWSNYAYVNGFNLFSDEDNNGFDDEYEERMPYPSELTFDVSLTITTTRTALLSWENDGIIIPPCTNKVVKLRLDGSVDTGSIDLIAHPEGTSLSGLWKAQMVVEYDLRYSQESEQKRIKLRNGYYVDFDTMESEFIGYINSAQQYGRRNQNPSNKITLQYESKTIYFDVDMTGACLEHGPNPHVFVYASTNIFPLCVSSGGETATINDDIVDITTLFSANVIDANPLCVSVYKEESDVELRIEESITIERSKICRPAETNIVGACWTSSHNPNDASDHLPRYEEVEVQFGPNCPTVTDVNAKIGFSHDFVNTRNLPIIENSSELDKTTDHCIGIIYSKETIDIWSYVDEKFNHFKNDILLTVNGDVKDSIALNKQPKRFKPKIYFITIKNKYTSRVLDSMWLTINATGAQNEFDNWYIRNSNTNWIKNLPKPSPSISITTNFWGNVVCSYLDASFSDFWGDASEVGNSYLHHNASFSARSVTIAGGHGNQACYDNNGKIITSTIAGGTADFAAGRLQSVRSHIREDVNPFIDALQLDGNPGEIDWLNEIQRPCIYQGDYLNKYLERRPIIQPTTENQNENTN